MTQPKPRTLQRARLLPGALALTALAAALAAWPAVAEVAPPPAAAATAADDGDEITRELIDNLVENGALKRPQAEKLIGKMRARIAARRTAKLAAEDSVAPPVVAPAEAARAAQSAGSGGAVDASGGVHVTYVPESEKQRIREELKGEVLAQARSENWAQPNTFPEWVSRLRFDGDFRFRAEGDYYDPPRFDAAGKFVSGNFPSINYQAINSGNPYNTTLTSSAPPPYLDTNEDRQLLRIRARLGLIAKIDDDLDVGLRFATGNTTNPVSTNQTLGNDFNKETFTVDRAYLNYRPLPGLSLWAGRAPNPYMSTELVFDDDLNFDGVTLQYKRDVGHGLRPFFAGGAYALYNTAFDFPSTGTIKSSSRDRWLFASQIGTDWKLADGIDSKFAIAYYDYYNARGKLSSLCFATQASDICDSDNSRPGFIQKGNTLFALRDLNIDPSVPNTPQYQYFGLASRFRELDVNAQLDLLLQGPLHAVFNADYVNNLGFDRSDIEARFPVNNFGIDGGTRIGNQGFFVQALVGYPKVVERWQWNLAAGYRRLESDAVVDGFTDSDFHLGGTNAKGYTLAGQLGFARNAWLSARWLSSTEASGTPLAIDVLQIDLNARF